MVYFGEAIMDGYKIKRSEILNEYTMCVYCYGPADEEISCCGENHFEHGYETENENYLEHEIEIIEDQ